VPWGKQEDLRMREFEPYRIERKCLREIEKAVRLYRRTAFLEDWSGRSRYESGRPREHSWSGRQGRVASQLRQLVTTRQ